QLRARVRAGAGQADVPDSRSAAARSERPLSRAGAGDQDHAGVLIPAGGPMKYLIVSCLAALAAAGAFHAPQPQSSPRRPNRGPAPAKGVTAAAGEAVAPRPAAPAPALPAADPAVRLRQDRGPAPGTPASPRVPAREAA